ncbi:MAG: alcohol dehydrogenase catalytic domain-containing protein [Nitrospiraceae bacterium]|nr:MAG: alcohol dehydrogenase catalytic domain-containing protein [Nitrospiraceae bacterium]
MKALVFDKKLSFVTDYPVPEPRKDEALIRVKKAGICNTDMEIMKGYMDYTGILGHEFTGVIEQCARKDLVGSRVAGEINISCGSCEYCVEQVHNHCPNRSVLGILNKDGVFAEYITLPVKNLHIIPEDITDDEAVFIEPLAAAYEILEQIKVDHSDRVCVLGDGKLGLLVGQVLSTTNCDLVVVGNHENKLALLEEQGIKTALAAVFGEDGLDVVVDCSGTPVGIAKAMSIVGARGTVVLKSTTKKRGFLDLNHLIVNEISLIGSRCGPFAPAIRGIQLKNINPLPLISKRFKLEDGLEAFEYASRKGVLKVILDVS